MTLTTLGAHNLTATYGGDANFNPSVSISLAHVVIVAPANYLAFGQQPGTILRGGQLNGVAVEVRDSSNAVVTGDNATQITLSINACGSPVTFGPVTVVNGVATFTNVGPHFYTIATGLQLNATSNPAYTAATSAQFAVVANPDLIFADGFDGCRL